MSIAISRRKISPYYSTNKRLAVVAGITAALFAEVFYLAKLLFIDRNDDTLLGLGVSYAIMCVFVACDFMPILKGLRVYNVLKLFLVFLLAPVFIQISIPIVFVATFFTPNRKARRIKNSRTRDAERLVSLHPLHVGDTVTFTPPNEDPVIGTIRRINAKSTTIVSQTGETWRVPHDQSGKIVQTKTATKNPRSVRKLELVR